MKILLTVPHAVCTNELIQQHFCDPIAEKMAVTLYQKLSKRNFVDLEVGNVPRPSCDLNRRTCRGTAFRREISRKMRSFDIVLDIHSYPNDSQYGPWDIVILEDRPFNENLSSVSLYEYLRSFGVNVGLLLGKDNDITDECSEKGVDAFLIEFNESLDGSYNDYLATLISNWLI